MEDTDNLKFMRKMLVGGMKINIATPVLSSDKVKDHDKFIEMTTELFRWANRWGVTLDCHG